MDAINNILQINDIINIHDDLNIQIPERAPVQHRVRGNLLDIPDREFKMRYRFDKDNVVHLANMLAPHLVRNDVHHGYQRLTPLETVCSALDILVVDTFNVLKEFVQTCAPQVHTDPCTDLLVRLTPSRMKLFTCLHEQNRTKTGDLCWKSTICRTLSAQLMDATFPGTALQGKY